VPFPAFAFLTDPSPVVRPFTLAHTIR